MFIIALVHSSGLTDEPHHNSYENSLLFALNVECKIRPEIRGDWLKEIKEDQLCYRRDEPDCLQFVLGQDVDDENTFYLFELYRNANAFRYHGQTPHFQAYASFVETSQPFMEEPRLCFYYPLEENYNLLAHHLLSNNQFTKMPLG